MYVNISRNKLLINNRRNLTRKPKKSPANSVIYCNHCGGVIRPNGEIETCIMCARESGHICENCLNGHTKEVADVNTRNA